MKRITIFLVAMAALFVSLPALAQQYYFIDRAVGAGSVKGYFVTDGTVGVLQNANILDFNLVLDDGLSTFRIYKGNAEHFIFGSSLTGSATDLSFNFSGDGFAIFQNPIVGSSINYFCLEATSCTGHPGNFIVHINGPEPLSPASGVVVFALAGVAPEPASWAMMILGFGIAGAAVRSRRRRAAIAAQNGGDPILAIRRERISIQRGAISGG